MTTTPPPRVLGKGLGAIYSHLAADDEHQEPAADIPPEDRGEDEVDAVLDILRSVAVPAGLAQAAAALLDQAAAGRPFTEARRTAAATVAEQLRAAARSAD
ncbi:hypothetical protein I5Q34_07320 [Streptomyces sp. AV19]|uniref:hypothetical protein n=1 Tax=Streptomyces sp. AV19 TaxID=2793068 RepID=UPI0018FE91A0|nr:hypothetical protein [Streptomyces sp. AV19]MBH1934105.1 hypothetical protein [Streptomyces sp. AV19]MDG4537173.1 hypothetical protein [Streptomyces sp. AV19]